jgi:D-3-phosphoglycerate dehydrogenase
MTTILTTTTSFAKEASDIIEPIKANGLRLVVNPLNRKLSEEELARLLADYEPVGLLAGTEPITRAVLNAARGYLKIISRVGVGWDNVDREAAQQMGIRVFRTEGVLAQAVAELTIGLILSALRHISLSDRLLRQGKWEKTMGGLLSGKVVGIIGFGNIGQRAGELITAFGAKVVYYDPQSISVPWAHAVSLPELLKQAEIITIHASGTERILGTDELEQICKSGVILINTARGELLDEAALQACLLEGRVSFACSYAKEARVLMERTAVENLLQGLYEVGVL